MRRAISGMTVNPTVLSEINVLCLYVVNVKITMKYKTYLKIDYAMLVLSILV